MGRRATIPIVLAIALFGGGLPGAAGAQPMRASMREPGVPGGRFVIGVTNDARTLNPIMSNETSSSEVSDLLFTALTEFDNVTQTPYPVLARSWKVSPDGLTWTWHLRRGARFSDGHPITAADVLFSFAVAYDSTLHQSIYDLLTPHGRKMQVSAPDSYTVVTRIARPHALMVEAVGALRILPRHVLEPAWRAGRFASSYGVGTPPESLVTSGPWMLRQFVAREKTVLTGNPYWFGVDARGRRLPYLDELVFLVVPDLNTATLKFQAGELDGIDDVKAEDYATFARNQASGGYTLHDLGAALTSNFFWFNLNTVKTPGGRRPPGAPLADPVQYAWFADPGLPPRGVDGDRSRRHHPQRVLRRGRAELVAHDARATAASSPRARPPRTTTRSRRGGCSRAAGSGTATATAARGREGQPRALHAQDQRRRHPRPDGQLRAG